MYGWIDILGYTASFIILVSLLMRSIVRLRWINAFGSVLFVVFAVLTHSIPVVVMNLGIIAIDLWYVFRISRVRADYQLVKAERGSAYLEFFYHTHQAEIDEIFGENAFSEAKGFSYFICNDEIAGLFAWKENTPTECQILIDFVTPRFRDSRIGTYFFNRQVPLFREKGYLRFVYVDVGQRHWKYLEKIGFTHESIGCFTKEIRSI